MPCQRVNPYWSTHRSGGRPEYHVCQNCDAGAHIDADSRQTSAHPPEGMVLCDSCRRIVAGLAQR
jgi:hypothetical protein